MLPDTRTPPPIPGMWRRGSETSFPNAASSAEAELAQESVAAGHEESAATNTSALRHRRSPCWRRDLRSGCGQRWRTYRYSCKSPSARLSIRKNKAAAIPAKNNGQRKSFVNCDIRQDKGSPTPNTVDANTTITATVNAIRLVTSKLRRLCLEDKIHLPGLAERFLFFVRHELS